jgi:hypothetical protein
MLNQGTVGHEEGVSALGGAVAIVAIYCIPLLTAAPQPVQGAVQLIVTTLLVYAVGFLPKPNG